MVAPRATLPAAPFPLQHPDRHRLFVTTLPPMCSAPRPPTAIKDTPMATWTAFGAPDRQQPFKMGVWIWFRDNPLSLARIGCRRCNVYYFIYSWSVLDFLFAITSCLLALWMIDNSAVPLSSSARSRECEAPELSSPLWICNLVIGKIFIPLTRSSLHREDVHANRSTTFSDICKLYTN